MTLGAPFSPRPCHDGQIGDGGGGARSEEDKPAETDGQPAEFEAGTLDSEEYCKQLMSATDDKVERIRRESNAAIAPLGKKIQGQMQQSREQMV